MDCAHIDPQPLDAHARTCKCGRWGYTTLNTMLKQGIPIGMGIATAPDNLPIRRLTDDGRPLG